VLAVLPYEIKTLEALSKKIPSTLYSESGLVSEYKKLAAALIGQNYKRSNYEKIGDFFKKLAGKIPQQEINRAVLKQSRLNIF